MAIKICLDAGHYGKYNRSPAVKAYYESDFTWKLHKLLKKYLEEYGVTVTTTRALKAVDLGLESRGKKAKGCDLFVSIHSNAVGSKIDNSTDYPLACCCVTGKADAIGKKLADCVADTMQTKQAARVLHKRYNATSTKDWYGVLRGAASVGVSGVLLEHSFHTNTSATNWLLQDSNLDRLAQAEAKVIADYYGLKKQEKVPYLVKTTCDVLNIRSGAGTNYKVTGQIKDKKTYTITKVKTGKGSTKGWGKLKSGAGWISLDHAEKVK